MKPKPLKLFGWFCIIFFAYMGSIIIAMALDFFGIEMIQEDLLRRHAIFGFIVSMAFLYFLRGKSQKEINDMFGGDDDNADDPLNLRGKLK